MMQRFPGIWRMNKINTEAFLNELKRKIIQMIKSNIPYSIVALIFLFISLAAILVIAVGNRQYGYNEADIVDTYSTRRATGTSTSTTGKITPGSCIVQGFHSGNTHVTRIQLETWAYQGDSSGFVHIELRDAQNTIAYWNYNMSMLTNEGWIELSLDHPFTYDTMNKDLYIVISSVLTDSQHATSFVTVTKDIYPEGGLYIDGRLQDADLQFIVSGTGRLKTFTGTRIITCIELTMIAELVLYFIYREICRRKRQREATAG